MELIFEVILQLVGEILLQVFFEILFELGLQNFANLQKKRTHPALAMMGFIFCGAIAGGMSLYIFPASAIKNYNFRLLNLFVTPIFLGAAMMLIGRAREKKGQNLVGLDRFGYAFSFAFVMALVRFIWAT